MTYKMYIGGYSHEGSSIYEVSFNSENNEFKIVSENNEVHNPIHLRRKENFLFVANELDDCARISSFKISEDGSIKYLSSLDLSGSQTCDITVFDNVVFGSNYGSGNIFTMVYDEEGMLTEVMSNIEHEGDEPRSHSTILSKNNQYLYEANLGLDRIFCYRVFPEGIIQRIKEHPFVQMNENEGPRHMSMSEDGKFLYVISEFGNSVTQFSIDETSGKLTQIDQLQLSDDVHAYGSDLHFGLNQNALYASIRGRDEIYHIDVSQNPMRVVGIFTSGGHWPRSFQFSDDKKYVFVVNQHSNNVVVLNVDPDSGSLSVPIATLEILSPTTITV